MILLKKKEINFNAETAIKVCRQSGYPEHALEIAKRFQEHHWTLKILLEDLKKEEEALKYIQKLKFSEIEDNMIRYGQNLVSALPNETIEFLLVLCTGWVPLNKVRINENKILPISFTPSSLLTFSLSQTSDQETSNPSPEIQHEIKCSTPDKFLPIFVNQPEALMKFLESIVQKGKATELTYNTLLELYLIDYGDEESQQTKKEKKRQSYESDYERRCSL